MIFEFSSFDFTLHRIKQKPSLSRVRKVNYFKFLTHSLVVIFVIIFFLAGKSFAFVLSNEACYGDVYPIDFNSEYIVGVDKFKVHVSETSLSPDLRIRIVSDPDQADLILVDEFKSADASVCLSNGLSNNKDTIYIVLESQSYNSSIHVNVSANEMNPDHSLFLQSGKFDVKMAAALFAVLRQSNKSNQKSETLRRNQPSLLDEDTYSRHWNSMQEHHRMQRSIKDSLFK